MFHRGHFGLCNNLVFSEKAALPLESVELERGVYSEQDYEWKVRANVKFVLKDHRGDRLVGYPI